MSFLNPALKAAQNASNKMLDVLDNNTCFRVEAGAGAGKTYSLVEALHHLIKTMAEEFKNRGQKVACITYTNVAADQVRQRIDNHPLVYIETIHAFSWSILKLFQSTLRLAVPEISDKWKERIKEVKGIKSQEVVYSLGFPSADRNTIELHHDDVIKLMAKFLEIPKFRWVLRNKYPILLIDEYQDTNIELATSLVKNLIEQPSGILIGFFGDHWQKIYGSKACGLINSKCIQEIGKDANFRSEKNIVDCLNRFRPELPQHEVDPNSHGEIHVFHSNAYSGKRRTNSHWKGDLPEDVAHDYLIRTKDWLHDKGWSLSSGNTKILMLTHNVLASELGYSTLKGCFKHSDDYIKKNDHYLKFFLETVEPLCENFTNGSFGLMFSILGRKHTKLTCQQDKIDWHNNLNRLTQARNTGTVRDVLNLLKQTSCPRLTAKVVFCEERLAKIVSEEGEGKEISSEDVGFRNKIEKLKSIPYTEVMALYSFVENKTPFSTKHGVKGDQCDEVLVVCGRGWNHYNWNLLFENLAQKTPVDKDSTYERSRNLFYVSCSRARKKLALLFTQELTKSAMDQVKYIFGEQNVHGEPGVGSMRLR